MERNSPKVYLYLWREKKLGGWDCAGMGLLRVTNKYTSEWSGLTIKRLYIVQAASRLFGIILHGILLTLQRRVASYGEIFDVEGGQWSVGGAL